MKIMEVVETVFMDIIGEERISMNFKRVKQAIDYINQKQAFIMPLNLFETTYPLNRKQ